VTNLPLRVEAAQFALLRRLAPSLRHRMIGGLHPITLLAELAARRLTSEPPDLVSARDAVAKIQGQAQAASASAVATLAWITGEEAASVSLKAGIEECVVLVRTDSEMRGAAIASLVAGADVAVSRRALRTVFTAMLVCAVDAEPHPARIEVHAAEEDGRALVRVETRSLQEPGAPVFADGGRPLAWEDVEVLAQFEGVEVRANAAPAVLRGRFRRYTG
jgi:hypothetical protein